MNDFYGFPARDIARSPNDEMGDVETLVELVDRTPLADDLIAAIGTWFEAQAPYIREPEDVTARRFRYMLDLLHRYGATSGEASRAPQAASARRTSSSASVWRR